MNLFQKYGIKEVADVVFYSITQIGDEEFYTPVLFLDTLKVSTLEKSAEKVEAKGGKGNKKLITWNFGKEITLNLEDALFSPASMSMIWGGKLNAKLSDLTSAIVKCNMANKYAELHYSLKAYPSPALTDREWECVFHVLETTVHELSDTEKQLIRDDYFKREATYIYDLIGSGFKADERTALPQIIIDSMRDEITKISDIGYIDHDIYDIEVIDRMEKCIVTNRDGFTINIGKQKDNLMRYYSNDKSSSYTIYYDAKTMLPLFPVTNDKISDFITHHDFRLKVGTIYYKWTRTVKYKEDSVDDGVLGKSFIIDAETFPDTYRIVGETYIRNQKTGKDQRYQFTIFKANVSSDTSITLEAEGDPTTFSMQIDVLTPPNDIMMELKQFDIEEDIWEGGTRIIPQKSKYSYTPTNVDYNQTAPTNDEMY